MFRKVSGLTIGLLFLMLVGFWMFQDVIAPAKVIMDGLSQT